MREINVMQAVVAGRVVYEMSAFKEIKRDVYIVVELTSRPTIRVVSHL